MLRFIQKNYIKIDIAILFLIIFCFITLINFKLSIKFEEITTSDNKQISTVTKDDNLSAFMNNYNNLIHFYAELFQIDSEMIIKTIVLNNENKTINIFDPFNTGTPATSVDAALMNYLLQLEDSNPELFSNKFIPFSGNKEYILALIDYYTTLFNQVDPATAKAIIEVESGYNNPYMLKKNNLFGLITNGQLIKYKNIEYGVLKYIMLLNEKYFSLGLKTIEEIGYKFNPIINNGIKIANPRWTYNVRNALNNYSETKNITIFDLLIYK